MEENKRTCLYDKHLALGALMSPFGGFDMPIQYSGIVDEHQSVRNDCGIFDVSHMGEVLITGEDAEKFVNYIFTNDIKDAPNGKIFYGLMLYPTGGAVDDLLVYKVDTNKFFLVINAANIDKDIEWIRSHKDGFDVNIQDQCDYYGEVAVQGPNAEKYIEEFLDLKVADLEFYTFKEIQVGEEIIIVSRTGYTGEDGFELYGSHKFINDAWGKLIDSGKVKPCGLGCRDTLRFEVGLPLYGDELSAEITPIEACLGIFVKLDKDDFIGKDAIKKQKEEGAPRKLVGIELADKAIPRHGYEVLSGDTVIGYVTTGYHCISVDKSVALALIDSSYAKMGNPVKIHIRKKFFDGTIVGRHFYKKSYKK